MAETWIDVRPVLYIASRQGLLALAEGGGDADVQPYALNGSHVNSIHRSGGTLLVGTGAGVLHSQDGGRTFSPARGIDAVPARLLGGSGRHVFAAAGASLARSDDGGRSFLAVAAPGEGPVRAALVGPATVLAATAAGGCALSSDGGGSFRAAGDGLEAPVLCLRPAGGDAVLAGTEAGLYRSERPGSAPWRRLWHDMHRPNVTAVGVDPGRPDRLVCGVARRLGPAKPGLPGGSEAGLFRSDDGGVSLAEASYGRMRVLRGFVTAIVLAGPAGERVLAGTTPGELLESRDGGRSFALAAACLPGVEDMAAGPALGA